MTRAEFAHTSAVFIGSALGSALGIWFAKCVMGW